MYRVNIDYQGGETVEDHWYGNHGQVLMPSLGDTKVKFYNLVSLKLNRLPIQIENPLERVYLPHYLTSNVTVEDLYFEFERHKPLLINDLSGGMIEVFPDYIDHRPRNVTFERLTAEQDPASPLFDEESLIFPHHQLGGIPVFKQPGGHELRCVRCDGVMSFLLQFDSDERLDADFEDDGAAFFWWCSRCQIIGCRVESS